MTLEVSLLYKNCCRLYICGLEVMLDPCLSKILLLTEKET